MADLTSTFAGITSPNPFWLASAPHPKSSYTEDDEVALVRQYRQEFAMKYLLLLFLLMLFCPIGLQAQYRPVTLEDLANHSDIIVVGTLRNVAEYSSENYSYDYGEGTIEVEEVIKSQGAVPQQLNLTWSNRSEEIYHCVEHRHNQDVTGIWLLNDVGDGCVEAQFPGRFVGLTERARVESALAQQPGQRQDPLPSCDGSHSCWVKQHPQTITATPPVKKRFTWVALARGLAVLFFSFLIFRKFYCD